MGAAAGKGVFHGLGPPPDAAICTNPIASDRQRRIQRGSVMTGAGRQDGDGRLSPKESDYFLR